MTGYLMDTPREGERVERKTDRALTEAQLRWAGVGCGRCVLDLGCAAGTTCRMIAAMVGPAGRVVGVDASDLRIREAIDATAVEHPIEYRVGTASAIPAEDGVFDVAWSRFLFEYLDAPSSALREMIRVTRPGGIVCVSDLDGNCVWHEPIDASLRSEIDAALETFGAHFDPHAGRRLFGWAIDAGLHDVAIDVRPYHLIAGRIADAALEHWRAKLAGVRDALVARGWSSARAARLALAFEEHLLDPRTFTYSTIVTVRGTKA